jgi:hypothetical protein
MITFNGKPFGFGDGFKKALQQSVESAITGHLQKKLGPNVKIRKTNDGYVATGSKEEIERIKRSL